MNREEALERSVEAVRFHKNNGIKTHFFQDESYPFRLKNCDDGPVTIYTIGEMDLNDQHFVAIVGTRDSTTYGKHLCEQLVESFRDNNIVVVSGLAHGIDSWAHHFAVEYNVPTIAVLGHGLDRIYPHTNRNLAKRISRNGGLITEFIPGTNPDRENFPKRNRIVAGLCDATVVVESKTTGGSLITAYLANEYCRDVFAFPGNVDNISSSGCNVLIRNHQAQLIDSPECFLNQMGWLNKPTSKSIQRKILPHLSTIQQSILSFIENSGTVQTDLIALGVERHVSEVNTELLYLELEGLIKSMSGNRYCLI